MDTQSILSNKHQYEELLTAYVKELQTRCNNDPYKQSMLQQFADFRGFNLSTVQSAGIFYIGEMVEMLLPDYFDNVQSFGIISPANNMPIFNNRWVIPIKNENGLVENLVGYSASANERYIYGTAKYYRRRDTLYGLENLKLAYEMGYAILAEGITDTIRLRDLGYPNSFAMCGTHGSQYIINQLNRCKHGVIRIPDRDKAGTMAVKQWNFLRYITLRINLQYKDLDAMCKASKSNQDILKQYIDGCIDWLKKEETHGKPNHSEEVTIL